MNGERWIGLVRPAPVHDVPGSCRFRATNQEASKWHWSSESTILRNLSRLFFLDILADHLIRPPPISAVKKIREQFLDLLPGLSITEKLFDTFEDVVFCVKERSGRYVLVNKAFVHRLNLPNKEAVLGRTARELFPAALAETYERQDAFVFGSGREIQNTLEMNINGDGTTGWYLSQKIPLFDGEKQMIGLVGISQDLKTATGQDAGPEALAAVIAEIQRDYEKPLRMEDLTRKVRMADY